MPVLGVDLAALGAALVPPGLDLAGLDLGAALREAGASGAEVTGAGASGAGVTATEVPVTDVPGTGVPPTDGPATGTTGASGPGTAEPPVVELALVAPAVVEPAVVERAVVERAVESVAPGAAGPPTAAEGFSGVRGPASALRVLGVSGVVVVGGDVWCVAGMTAPVRVNVGGRMGVWGGGACGCTGGAFPPYAGEHSGTLLTTHAYVYTQDRPRPGQARPVRCGRITLVVPA